MTNDTPPKEPKWRFFDFIHYLFTGKEPYDPRDTWVRVKQAEMQIIWDRARMYEKEGPPNYCIFADGPRRFTPKEMQIVNKVWERTIREMKFNTKDLYLDDELVKNGINIYGENQDD